MLRVADKVRQPSEVSSEGERTYPTVDGSEHEGLIPRFELTVLSGSQEGETIRSEAERCTVGSLQANDLVLTDQTVSRFHCDLSAGSTGVRVRDLGSLNGTWVRGMRLLDAIVPHRTELRLGNVLLRVELAQELNRVCVSSSHRFGNIVGESDKMRRIFSILERVAPSNSTVLLEGETGSGKGAVAEAIHRASGRAHGPFSVVDCGALPPSLLESELFGHERGAFTGAHERRMGAFEEANGGTLLLDEIGELPVALQPKLLRVLENRTIKRLGSNAARPIDVRIVAATNRDLREEVNRGSFRADLYFRLAVVPVLIPPLRERPEDIVPIARALLLSLGQDLARTERFLSSEIVDHLRAARWPGNVRELRNYLERALLVADDSLFVGESGSHTQLAGAALSYSAAKDAMLARFERDYVQQLLDTHRGKVAVAANAAGLTREHVYRLLRKHGISLRS